MSKNNQINEIAFDLEFPVKFLEDKIEVLKVIEDSIATASSKFQEKYSLNSSSMSMETKLKQYDTAIKVLKLLQNNDSAVQALSVFLDLI